MKSPGKNFHSAGCGQRQWAEIAAKFKYYFVSSNRAYHFFLITLICLIAEPSRLTIFKLFNYPDRLLAIRYALIKREQGELCYLVPAHLHKRA